MKQPSNKWLQMKEVYLCFRQQNCDLDYSDAAASEMFIHESQGNPVSPNNGFYWCKRNMDITLAMWEEDITKGELTKFELYQKEVYPTWWLDQVLDLICVPESHVLNITLESKKIPDHNWWKV